MSINDARGAYNKIPDDEKYPQSGAPLCNNPGFFQWKPP